MSIKSDFHLHSTLSADGKASMEDMIQKGISMSLDEMCMTEHQDLFFIDESGNRSDAFTINMTAYKEEYERMLLKYGDKINLSFGIELGLSTEVLNENLEFVKSHPFDFVIGSLHICNGGDPYYPAFFENRTDKEAYTEYFLELLENVKLFTDFDVCGHLDYIVRYGKTKNLDYNYLDYADIFDELLKFLIDSGKGIECNTGSLNPKYQLGDTNPSLSLLKRYKELGGEIITIGSDAHRPEDMCCGFDKAFSFLTKAGFRYYTTFKKREPIFFKLNN